MYRNTKLVAVLVLLSGLFFQSCTDERSDPDQSARVKVKLVDFPGDYLEVNVDIIDVLYNISNSEDEANEEGWTSFDSFEPQLVDLTDLTGGVNLILADEILPAGYLSQIRLILSENGNTIVVEGNVVGEGTSYPLETPSAQQSGLKIKINETLEGGFSYDIILDWDVQKSIVKTGNGRYQLKPVINANLAANSAIINGYVFGDLAEDDMDEPVALENVVVNLFEASSNLSGEPEATTSTDEDGRYWLEGLSPGVYNILIEREGFERYISTEITVSAGDEFDNQTITLTPVG